MGKKGEHNPWPENSIGIQGKKGFSTHGPRGGNVAKNAQLE